MWYKYYWVSNKTLERVSYLAIVVDVSVYGIIYPWHLTCHIVR